MTVATLNITPAQNAPERMRASSAPSRATIRAAVGVIPKSAAKYSSDVRTTAVTTSPYSLTERYRAAMPTLRIPARAANSWLAACDAELTATFWARPMPRPRRSPSSTAGCGSVVVATARCGREVGDDAEGVACEQLDLLAEVLRSRSRRVVQRAHDDDAGDLAHERPHVADVRQRGAVDDHDVELALELVEHARHAGALQELEGVRRDRAAGQQRQLARLAGLCVHADRDRDQRVVELRAAEHRRQADLRGLAVEHARGGLVEIGLHEHDAVAHRRHRRGEEARDGRLAVAGHRARHEDRLQPAADVEVAQVGAQRPEGLQLEAVLGLLVHLPADPAHLRHAGQHRQSVDVLEVLRRVQRLVEAVAQVAE